MSSRASLNPPAKRPRLDEEQIVVPTELCKKIRQSAAGPAPPATAPDSGRCVLLCWNIDGIDETGEKDRMFRTLAVAQHIANVQPAAVLLQEVIPPMLELLLAPQLLGAHYEPICPENPRMPYYCIILLHKQRARLLALPRTVHFERSQMGRHFLAVDVAIDGRTDAPMTLVTTHLESTKSERPERVRQLTEVFLACAEFAKQGDRTVALAGDLNIRDDEVTAARKQAREKNPRIDDIVDAWIWCGSPAKHQWTWDTSVNTNLGVTYSCKCRFDRWFVSVPAVTHGHGGARAKASPSCQDNSSAGSRYWCPCDVELVGRTKVEGLGRFPSDHFGIQITMKLGQASIVKQGNILKQGCVVPVGTTAPATSTSGGNAASIMTTQSSTSSTPVDEEERRRRRELIAAKAEERLQGKNVRGIGNVKKVPTALDTAAVFAARTSQSADASPAARSSSTAISPPGPRTANDAPVCAAEEEDDDDEDAMMARAIALSLQGSAASSTGIAAASAISGSFQSLASTSAAVIDLD